MITSLSTVVEQALPIISGGSVTYNKQNNIYLTNGYTSAAGNTYYQGIRLSDRIALVYDLGQGYAYTFLNGIKIFGYNGRDKKLIAQRCFNCYFFSEANAKNEAIDMIKDYMKGQAKLMGASLSDSQISEFSRQLVSETMRNNPQRLLA